MIDGDASLLMKCQSTADEFGLNLENITDQGRGQNRHCFPAGNDPPRLDTVGPISKLQHLIQIMEDQTDRQP